MHTEEWLQVIGFDGISVSSLGNVRRWNAFKSQYTYPLIRIKDSHAKVTLPLGYKRQRTANVAKLVAVLFCGAPMDKRLVTENIDGNPRNNAKNNIAWTTEGSRVKNIPIGFKSGRLTVMYRSTERSSDKQHMYTCVCSCGNTTNVRGQHIRNKMTLSCGCLHSEVTGNINLAHGHTRKHMRSKAYRVWTNMKTRCTNPNAKSYENYGGRGITVCSAWKKFKNFYNDMGDPPDGLTLDRVNNEKGYCKDNCRWADWFQQANNRRAPAT